MQQSFKNRLAALEVLEAQRQAALLPLPEPRYRLCTPDEVTRWVFLLARGHGMTVQPGGVLAARALSTDEPDLRELRGRVADALNGCRDWGELLTSGELAAARVQVAAGHFVYHVRVESWDVFSTGWKLRDFIPYPLPFNEANALYPALPIAAALAERHGPPLLTQDALQSWLDTAYPFRMTPALYAAVGEMWTRDADDETVLTA